MKRSLDKDTSRSGTNVDVDDDDSEDENHAMQATSTITNHQDILFPNSNTEENTPPPDDNQEEVEADQEVSHKKKRQRKYCALSIQQKKEVIDLIDKKRPYDEISKKFGVSSGTISNIKENRKVIDSILEKNVLNPNMKQIKPRMTKESQILDEKLFSWLNAARERYYTVTGPKLIEKAKIISEHIGMEFKGSNGWLESFKKRHSISFRNILPLERHPDIPMIDPNDTDLKDWEMAIIFGENGNTNHENGRSDSDNEPEEYPRKTTQSSSALQVATHTTTSTSTRKTATQQQSTSSATTNQQLPSLQQARSGLTNFLTFIDGNKSAYDSIGMTAEIRESFRRVERELSRIK